MAQRQKKTKKRAGDAELIHRLNKDWSLNTVKIKKAGGQTNRNWIVSHKNKKFFVRFPWERSDIVDRGIEGKNILAISKRKKLFGIVPKFFIYVYKKKNILSVKRHSQLATSSRSGTEREDAHFNFSDGTMITEYIEGKDIDGKDLEKPEIQKALLGALHGFHSSGVKFVNVYDVFRDEILKYKKEAKKYPVSKLIKKEKIKEIEKIEKEAKKRLPLGGKVSTHNDLIFENLRLGKDGKIYLLDFEYGGFNIRQGIYYDLGIILGGNLFQKNPIKIETFEEILEKAERIYKEKFDKKKIYFGALVNILVMFWWGLVKYFTSETKEEKKYFKNYVLKRAKRIDFISAVIRRKNSP